MADTYLDWWTSIDTDVRKSIIVNARRGTERLHALVRMAYEHGQASILASRPAEVDGSPVNQACARVRSAEAELKAARKALVDAMTTAARTDE